ncbi:MAG TPA: hypothetical protein VG797_03660, partial [Phycisphaerales bacterium]|nr:hypothetical protein [Phycisphaerales bacterium]
ADRTWRDASYVCPTRVRILALASASGVTTNPNIVLDDSAVVIASIHAPTASVDIAGASALLGRASAQDVRVREDCAVLQDPALDSRIGFTSPGGPLYNADGTLVEGLLDGLSNYIAGRGPDGLPAYLAACVTAGSSSGVSLPAAAIALVSETVPAVKTLAGDLLGDDGLLGTGDDDGGLLGGLGDAADDALGGTEDALGGAGGSVSHVTETATSAVNEATEGVSDALSSLLGAKTALDLIEGPAPAATSSGSGDDDDADGDSQGSSGSSSSGSGSSGSGSSGSGSSGSGSSGSGSSGSGSSGSGSSGSGSSGSGSSGSGSSGSGSSGSSGSGSSGSGSSGSSSGTVTVSTVSGGSSSSGSGSSRKVTGLSLWRLMSILSRR